MRACLIASASSFAVAAFRPSHGAVLAKMIDVDVQFLQCVSMFAHHRIQKGPVLLGIDERQQRPDGLADVAPYPEVELSSVNDRGAKRSSSPGTIRAFEANDRDIKSDRFVLRFRSIRVSVFLFDTAMK